MSKEDFEQSLVNNKPYFGPYLACSRSWPYIYWYQQKLIKFIAEHEALKSMKILEIGSAAGASAFSWAEAINRYFNRCGKILCVDIWEYSKLEDIGPDFEVGSSILSVFLHNKNTSGFGDLIDYKRQSSNEAFRDLKGLNFDVIYLDGDHEYQQVKRDIENSILHLKDGGFLCGDDLEIQVNPSNHDLIKNAIAQRDDWAIDRETETGFHPGVSQAVAECLGPVSCWYGFWAVQKIGSSFKNIDLSKVEAPIPAALMQYDYDGQKVAGI